MLQEHSNIKIMTYNNNCPINIICFLNQMVWSLSPAKFLNLIRNLFSQVSIREAKGLPPALSNFVFCQYNFWGHDDSIVVPPEISPDAAVMKKRNDSMTFRFEHNKVKTRFQCAHCWIEGYPGISGVHTGFWNVWVKIFDKWKMFVLNWNI